MHIRALVPIVLLACVATGGLARCGGDDVMTAEQQIRQVLDEYAAAVVAGRNDEICQEIFTQELAQTVEGTGSCETALGDPPQRFDLRVSEVMVDEDTRATAEITVSAPGTADQGGAAQEAEGSIDLIRQDGAWRISEIGA